LSVIAVVKTLGMAMHLADDRGRTWSFECVVVSS
jgi:hypothetical protein